MIRTAFTVACIPLTLAWAVPGVAAEPLPEAKAKIAQCIEKHGDEYIEARNWLIEHPEALDLLGEDSWKERWIKTICHGWIENKALYERLMRGFELGEMYAKGSVRVGVPEAYGMAQSASRNYGDQPVPLMLECLWKTGRNWRRYKAWRMYAVVEYLKLHGDASVLDPAIDSLVSRSWNGKEAPEPGSQYPPRMDRFMTASAHNIHQLAPYTPVKLIVEFGDQHTLRKLESLSVGAEISDASKKVLRTATRLLKKRLDQKKRGEPVEEVELAVEFGDRSTLENLRVWEEIRGSEAFKQKVRARAAKLEKRLQEQEKPPDSD